MRGILQFLKVLSRFAYPDRCEASVDHLRPWLNKIQRELESLDAQFALVGGMAVAVRAEPRFTRDIDLAVAVADDSAAERILGGLIRRGYRPVAELDRKDRPRLAAMRLAPPGSDIDILESERTPIIDLIFAACGIEPEVVAAATPFRVFKRSITPVAQIPHLIAMKVLSFSESRPQDLADLKYLIERATAPQLGECRKLVALIMHRGYQGTRSLQAELERHIKRFRRQT